MYSSFKQTNWVKEDKKAKRWLNHSDNDRMNKGNVKNLDLYLAPSKSRILILWIEKNNLPFDWMKNHNHG